MILQEGELLTGMFLLAQRYSEKFFGDFLEKAFG